MALGIESDKRLSQNVCIVAGGFGWKDRRQAIGCVALQHRVAGGQEFANFLASCAG